MVIPTWKDINGKTIKYKLHSGQIIEALVIANPDVGISIKPMDPADVPLDLRWIIPPSDPNFFLICMDSPKKRRDTFDHWVKVLSEEREFFTVRDIASGFTEPGTCPFSR